MHIIDIGIFAVYMAAMIGIGFFFMRKNKGGEDYFVGGRKMGSLHVGMSVVATDVGGGVWGDWVLPWVSPDLGCCSPDSSAPG
jgi:Na+/proline symporter